jgi:tetratricopeptide (TPR) repeat protein
MLSYQWDNVTVPITSAKYNQPTQALEYLETALIDDTSNPKTDMRPITHVRGQSLRGRILAQQGQAEDAEAAFAKAVEVAHRTGMRLLEALALRDFRWFVLTPAGRSGEVADRLRVVLRAMEAPRDEIALLVGGELFEEVLGSI